MCVTLLHTFFANGFVERYRPATTHYPVPHETQTKLVARRAAHYFHLRNSPAALQMYAIWVAALTLGAARESDDCGASDANLLFRRQRICASLTQAPTYYCGESWQNVSKDVAHEDWPSQATYMHDMLAALSGPITCLNTSYGKETVEWMNTAMSNETLAGGSFMGTWLDFQVGYFQTPMPPTAPRIESPSTLGRKCWAFAYLKQLWEPTLLETAVQAAGLNISSFISE